MLNPVNRAPQIPRKIRDIRPKRQLARDRESESETRQQQQQQQQDDDWWRQADNADEVAHFRGGTTVNRLNRANKSTPSTNAKLPTSEPSIQEVGDADGKPRNGIIHNLAYLLGKIRQSRKKIFWGLMIMISWRTIYLLDLEQYTHTEEKGNTHKISTVPHDVRMKSIEDEISLLDKMTDDMLTSTFDKSPAVGGSKISASLIKPASIQNSMSRTDTMQFHPSGHMAESVRYGANEFVDSYHKDMSVEAALSHFSSPLRGKETTSRTFNNPNSQNLMSNSMNNPISTRQTPGHMAESVRFGGNEFVDSYHKDPSLQAALSHLSSPLHGKETTSQSLNNQSRMSNYLSNPFSTPNNNILNDAPGSAAGLDCSDYGGPFDPSESADLVYWRDIPTDASFTSPFYNAQAQEATTGSIWRTKYLTFEMDDAGWNNMRLGLENMIILAHAMGRTLVMPPRRQMAHGVQSYAVSFSDFFDIEAIGAKQKGLNIITMEQFLEHEAINGHLKSYTNGDILYPPNNQVNWDNQRLQPLWAYIRNVTKMFQWNPMDGILAFPASGTDEQRIYSMMADVLNEKDGRPFPHFSEHQGKPVNVDAPPIERFREILAGRRQLFMYDRKSHDDNSVVHFKADQVDGTRLIVPFYAFMWFEDWRHDLWTKRFIRDNLRYKTEIMCLSARIISAIRDRTRKNSLGNMDGLFDAVHIRRGDFQQQFPSTAMNASDVLTGMKEYIAPGSTVFISTNERDRSFFTYFGEVYDVVFLDDFRELLTSINTNYFPLIEQIVASRGRIFIGTFFSTFSAYITRLRGYYSVQEMHNGYMTGGLHNTYFLPAKWKKEMRLYQAVHVPIFGRDFPVAWRDIDRLQLPL